MINTLVKVYINYQIKTTEVDFIQFLLKLNIRTEIRYFILNSCLKEFYPSRVVYILNIM